jgi:TorA maturation chaperone TorD
MHFLCEREKEAWKAEDESIVLDYLKREEEFIHNHLIQWVPDLCDRICEKTKKRYFKGIAKITDAFIRTEYETLNSIFD